jgi:hypothetical protein
MGERDPNAGHGGGRRDRSAKQVGRAFITAPVMITYPVAYTIANIMWYLGGFFVKGGNNSAVVGILATLIVSAGIFALDLLTSDDEESNVRIKLLYAFFNFLLLVGGVLHIEVPALDVAQP